MPTERSAARNEGLKPQVLTTKEELDKIAKRAEKEWVKKKAYREEHSAVSAATNS